MILSLFNCILLFTLICCRFGIAKKSALFGVTFSNLKFGWCKENDILQVCEYDHLFTESAHHWVHSVSKLQCLSVVCVFFCAIAETPLYCGLETYG